MEKVSQDMINELLDENILKKRYDTINNLIYYRVEDIVGYISSLRGCWLHWYDYNNRYVGGDDNESENNTGFFDANRYKTEIILVGSFKFPMQLTSEFTKYVRIPTRWLFDDNYKSEVNALNEESLRQEIKLKAKKEEEKALKIIKREKIMDSIKNKLTAEEFSLIEKFRSNIS